jgi:pyrroloquinoline quinone biosynthesis protein B
MSKKFTLSIFTILLFLNITAQTVQNNTKSKAPFLVVLGTLQDGGSPHIGCEKDCCKKIDANKKIVSLGLIDPASEKKFIIEATPDITSQIKILNECAGNAYPIDGILLSHAHIGHYSGLMYLGKEANNAKNIPVYAMPRMKKFIENNGPWSQLVNIKNIQLIEIFDKQEFSLSSQLKIIPYQVPHRDEFSETIGFKIIGPNKSALFIPDIDKWEKWEINIIEIIKSVDYAFIDGTFWDTAELNNRAISEIPHPLIKESILKFTNLPASEKNKIWFIHLNHTNPVLITGSKEYQELSNKGFHISTIKQVFPL